MPDLRVPVGTVVSPQKDAQSAVERQVDSGRAQTQLRRRLDELLEESLGLSVLPRYRGVPRIPVRLDLPRGPLRGASAMAVFYLAVFVAVPWSIDRFLGPAIGKPLEIMLLFQLYGTFWSAWATATTRMASNAVASVLDVEVLPRLSERSAQWILGALDKPDFQRRRLLLTSWAIGIASGALAIWCIQRDLPELPNWALAFWGVGWALLYTTAAKVVNVSRFYEKFAQALVRDPDCLYPLSPAKSPLVVSLKAVSQRMLLFWFGIVVSIAAIIPFNLFALTVAGKTAGMGNKIASIGSLHLTTFSFVLGHLVITTIFSFGLGTLIFLRSEAALRIAIRAAANNTLSNLKAYSVRLLANEPSEKNFKLLNEVSTFYDHVSAGGSYQAMLIGGLSVLLPFLPLIYLLLGRK